LLYLRHKEALDLIYDHRIDRQATIRQELQGLVDGVPELQAYPSSTQVVRFQPKAWDVPELQVGEGWPPSRMIIAFELLSLPDRIRLQLQMGPGPVETRSRLHELARRHQPPFVLKANHKLTSSWTVLWSDGLVPRGLYAEGKEEELLETLNSRWENFISNPTNPHGLRAFTAAVCQEFGIGNGSQAAADGEHR
jgi:hypothetical protein